MIRAVLLDIDDTLLDFDQAAYLSIQEGFARLNLPFTEEVMAAFRQVNQVLWPQLERGMLTPEGLYHLRWVQVFQRLGLTVEGAVFEGIFRQGLRRYVCPIEGALSLVQYLSARYTLCAASNGPYSQQARRLDRAGMLPYFHHLFISEQIGFSKPSCGFFDHCFAALSPVKPSEAIFVGDSLTADMAGGMAYGLRTCWFNPKRLAAPDGCNPDFSIAHLGDLMNVL